MCSFQMFRWFNLGLVLVAASVVMSCASDVTGEEYCKAIDRAFQPVSDQIDHMQGVIDRNANAGNIQFARALLPNAEILYDLTEDLKDVDRPKSAKELHGYISDFDREAMMFTIYLKNYIRDRDPDSGAAIIETWGWIVRFRGCLKRGKAGQPAYHEAGQRCSIQIAVVSHNAS